MPDDDLRRPPGELIALMADAVREAGAIALAKFRTQLKSWTKGKDSPVTEVDIAVDEFLRTRLRAYAPDYGWLSEETVDDRARLDVRRIWVVDPIDGTRGYMAGMPDWTIVAALVEDGRPIAGAVYAPVGDQMFLAEAGQGATVNGKPAAASIGAVLEGARVGGPRRRVEALTAAVPGIDVVPRGHSLALRLARVAEGSLDVALVGPNSQDWDLAAADLLVHEAGGVLTDIDGRQLRYNRPETTHPALIAAGVARHATLLAVCQSHRADFN